MAPRRAPALNDAQKGDLSALWERHAPSQVLSLGGGRADVSEEASFGSGSNGNGGRRGRGGRGRGRGRGGDSSSGIAPTTVVTMTLEDEDYHFICRLYSFLRWIVCIGVEDPSSDGHVMPSPSASSSSRTRESLMFLFQRVHHVHSNGANSSYSMVPKIIGGNQLISLNHALFLEEMGTYEGGSSSHIEGDANQQSFTQQNQCSNNGGGSSSSFGSYLYRTPDRALASLSCSIGLTVLTLWRRHQTMTQANAFNSLHGQNNQQHPHLSTFDTALYRPRFYHLASQVRMANIRTSTVDRLVSLRGTVTKARPKRLRVLDSGFVCTKCGLHQISKFMDGKYSSPTKCEDMKCRSQKFVLNRKVANFCDVQELKIQEVREECCEDIDGENGDGVDGGENREAGRAPRHMEVEVVNDLVDMCHAGDSIVVVGIVRAVNSALASGRVGKRAVETSTYKLYVVAHSIVNLTAEDGTRGSQGRGSKHGAASQEKNLAHGQIKRQRTTTSMNYTDEQLQQIANLAHADHRMYSMPTRMSFPFDLLVRSLCPSIIGNDLVKAGIVLCLLGGTPPEVSGLEAQSGMTVRSNSHMLVVGDPGMGKSQMLLSANQVASRSVYVGGNTASSTGLTVSLTKEPGGDMGIEAGALVLADRGVCCLDELDKLPRSHQDGLLEAMEQQQVSIAKAGVVASLPSRCSVIAAANPKNGHYNLGKSVAENLNMAGPLLSRFDLVFILRDEADSDKDRMISCSIMGRLKSSDPHRDGDNNFGKSAGRLSSIMDQYGTAGRVPLKYRLPWVTDSQKQPLPLQQVKDYIAYAREHCRPKMTADAAAVLHSYFMKLR